jgi:hypothetical protein
MPDSDARAQVRAMRKADPNAWIVMTDAGNPNAPPPPGTGVFIWPPGTQPPPPGRLAPGTLVSVPYPH